MGKIKKVLANVAQTLTDAEKAQARQNIGVEDGGSDIFDCFVYLYQSTPSGTPYTEIYDAMSAGKLIRLKAILSVSGTYVYCYPYGSATGSMGATFIGYDPDGYIYEVYLNTYQTVRWSYSRYQLPGYYVTYPSGASNVQIPAGQNSSQMFNINIAEDLLPGIWQMTGVMHGSAYLGDYNLASDTYAQGASQTDTVFFARIGQNGSTVLPHGYCGGAVVRSAYSYRPDVGPQYHTMTVPRQPVSCLFQVQQTTSTLPIQFNSETLSAQESAILTLSDVVFRQVISAI